MDEDSVEGVCKEGEGTHHISYEEGYGTAILL
jgi:hypothetical protein